jgi:competence protein ComEC
MSSGSGIVNLNKNKGLILKRLAFWLKRKTQEIIYKHVSSLTAAILDAMILGERKNIPWFVDDAMMKSGTVHIIVVSGFNVSIITFILLLFLKIVRVPPQARFFIAITCLILYCLATGASTPVVRATVMAVFFLAGYLLKREPDIYNSLSIAAIAILAVNPRQLSDIGFQLSFISVLSIVYLYPKLKLLLRTEALRMRLFKFIAEGYLVSFSAWLGTMGPIAYYFKIFSPVAVLANIFIVPLATLITLSGISLIAVSLICPGLAPFFAFTTELEVFALLKVNAFLVNLPFAYLRFL